MSYTPPRDSVFNNGNAGITKAVLFRALFSLVWHIPTSQVFALHKQTLEGEITEVTETYTELSIPQTKLTLFGIPVTVDNDLPQGVIELRHNGERLFTIDNIAIPNEFASFAALQDTRFK